jgi:uncharacterized protein (DUF952 family)
MKPIYYIARQQEFEEAQTMGHITPPSFIEEGFVHCSFVHQTISVANRYFQGQNNLFLLEIDRTKLAAPVIEENLSGGTDLYPHIYGILNLSAIQAIFPFSCTEHGSFELPSGIRQEDRS